MGHRLLAFWAAHLPLITFLLLVLFIVLFVFFEVRERLRARRTVTAEIQTRVHFELGNLVTDILRRSEEAHQQLAALAQLQASLSEQKSSLGSRFAEASAELDKLL